MLDFFSNTQGAYFQIYSIWHILQLLLVIVGSTLIYVYRNRLKKMKKKHLVLVIGAIILLLNRFTDIISAVIVGTFDFRVNLPLHLCLLTNIFFAIMVLFKKPKMFSFVYFFSLVGPIPALIFPQDTTFYDTYQFWENMISHHFLILLTFYALFVCDYKVGKKDFIFAAILLNIIFFIMLVFNIIFDTNYIFSSSLPDVVLSTLPFIKYFYHPIFWLEICGVIVFYLAHIPLRAIRKEAF